MWPEEPDILCYLKPSAKSGCLHPKDCSMLRLVLPVFRSLPKFMSIQSAMPSNHLLPGWTPFSFVLTRYSLCDFLGGFWNVICFTDSDLLLNPWTTVEMHFVNIEKWSKLSEQLLCAHDSDPPHPRPGQSAPALLVQATVTGIQIP